MRTNEYASVLSRFPMVLPPCPMDKDVWQTVAESDADILVYGMGNGADKLFAKLAEYGKTVSAVFASDGFVRGQVFHGQKVISFAEAKTLFPNHIILLSFGSNKQDVVEFLFSFGADKPFLIPDMPLAGVAYFTSSFYTTNYKKIKAVYDLWEDDISKDIYAAMVWYKLTGEPCFLKRAACDEDTRKLLGWDSIICALDVGAYRGDTLVELAENAPRLSTVIAMEPDKKNFKKLEAVAKRYVHPAVTCAEAAAWEADGEMFFAASGNRNATLKSDDKNGHMPSYEHKENMAKTSKIDTLLNGRKVDYIKFDTEGAEMPALRGAEHTIKTHTPFLRVSLYHKSEDLFALPLYLMTIAPEKYKYYLRRPSVIPAWEADLLAVPK